MVALKASFHFVTFIRTYTVTFHFPPSSSRYLLTSFSRIITVTDTGNIKIKETSSCPGLDSKHLLPVLVSAVRDSHRRCSVSPENVQPAPGMQFARFPRVYHLQCHGSFMESVFQEDPSLHP